MSQQRTDESPRDWRRRRGRPRPVDDVAAEQTEAGDGARQEQSRTLFSFIEPGI